MIHLEIIFFQTFHSKVSETVSGFHCVKSAQIWGFFWSVFSCIQIEYRDLLRKKLRKKQKKLIIWTLLTHFFSSKFLEIVK